MPSYYYFSIYAVVIAAAESLCDSDSEGRALSKYEWGSRGDFDQKNAWDPLLQNLTALQRMKAATQ